MQEIEREELLKERQGLVTLRLAQIKTEEGAQQAYWKAVSEMLLEERMEEKYLDPAEVSSLFGDDAAMFAFLYAICFQTASEKMLMSGELTCAVMELAVELYLMKAEHSSSRALRDTLYYFAVDYAEETALYHRTLLEKDSAVYGGPFLLSSAKTAKAVHWVHHAGDSLLYMGSRYAERYGQAVAANKARSALLGRLLKQFAMTLEEASTHQLDVLQKLSVSVSPHQKEL